MMLEGMLGYVVWNINPEILDFGRLQVRWYGLLFASGFFTGHYLMTYFYKREGRNVEELDKLLIYMVLAIVVGARLGHTLFYQPEYYLSNPIEILKVWEGGLASHGAAFGAIAVLAWYAWKTPGITFLWIADRIVITVALGGCFIRLGNLFNSEIYGVETNSNVGFVFARSVETISNSEFGPVIDYLEVEGTGQDTMVNGQAYTQTKFTLDFSPNVDAKTAELIARERWYPQVFRYEEPDQNFEVFRKFNGFPVPKYNVYESNGSPTADVYVWGVPRHPTQIYESTSSLLIFALLLLIYHAYRFKPPEGLNFGVFLTLLFSLRFFYETIKLNQVDFEDEMTLNLGQLLSIPLIIMGLIILSYSLYTHYNKKSNKAS